MSGVSGVEFVGVATSSNAAYELVKHARESEYDVVDESVPPVVPPPLPQDREGGYINLPRQYERSTANSPMPPPAVAPSQNGKGGTEEEAVYESIPGDQ